MSVYEKDPTTGKFRLNLGPAKVPESMEDALVRALERDRQAQMTPAEKMAASLADSKARLAEAGAGMTFEDLEANAGDGRLDTWDQPEAVPVEGLAAVMKRLGMV